MKQNQLKQVPIKKGLWVISENDKPQLIGSKCTSCDEIFFPKKEKGWCVHCHKQSLQDILLNRKGKIASFSVVMQQPGGGFYKGPVPYAYGCVDLPEGLRLETLFAVDDFDQLQVGRKVELIIDMLHQDEDGNDIVTFKFQPV